MPRFIRAVSVDEVRFVAHTLARQTMDWDEPIPEFDTRFPHVLEGCLAAPFQTFGKKLLYAGLLDKAAMLFYLLIKNHPFQNGNKRLALTTLMVFLHRNKKWIRVDTRKFYNFAVWVAESQPEVKDEVVLAVRKFISRHLVIMQ